MYGRESSASIVEDSDNDDDGIWRPLMPLGGIRYDAPDDGYAGSATRWTSDRIL